jgi:uncharacterized membrane protein YeaQ/YmgE (transglycosylase-associated protein family)
MNFLIWLVIGAFVGSVAAMIMRQSLSLAGNVAVGIVGAFLGGALFAHGDINDSPLTIGTFSVSVLGAIVLLGLVNLLRRGSLR